MKFTNLRFGRSARLGAAAFAGLGIAAFAAPASAATDPETAFIFNTLSFLMHGFLVMWMAAGFAMLEAGLVRTKNTTMQCLKNISLYSVAGIMYYLLGYNLMYMDVSGFIGSVSIWSAADPGITADGFVAGEGDYAAGSDWFFQMVFVAATASIVSGTVAERVKIWAFLAFTVVLTGIIYPIQGSWTWGGGWLSEMGFSDFAGSTIVHSVGGWAALAGAIVIGARKGNTPRTARSTPSRAPICRSPRSAPSSCGWAGSASTAARSSPWGRRPTCATSPRSTSTPTWRQPAVSWPRSS